jgi:predicted PurR-regulated permease PerM
LLWGLWVALVDFLPMIGGALAGIPTVLFAFVARGLSAGIVTAVVFLVYTQIENHVLNPVVMSKTAQPFSACLDRAGAAYEVGDERIADRASGE